MACIQWEKMQKGNPGQEYLGYNVETKAVSKAAAALSGDANLL